MAQVTFDNPFIASISGSLTKDCKYSYFTRNGKTFTRTKGQRTKPISSKELDQQQRFKRAIEWAKLVQQDTLLKASYHAKWKLEQKQYPTFHGYLMHYYYKTFVRHDS